MSVIIQVKASDIDASAHCGGCRHWSRLSDDRGRPIDHGECRESPPTVLWSESEQETWCEFPAMHASEPACGKFRGRH